MRGVVVVGAGVVGASVTYHLARLGVAVKLLDRAPGPAAGVTGGSFGWIGDGPGDWPGGAADLRPSVLADHRRLAADVPGAAVRWTGSLIWTDTPAAGRRPVGPAGIRALEPHLRQVPPRAAFAPGDGGVDPAGLTRALVDAARAHGATIMPGTAVSALTEAGGVVTPTGPLPATTVVLAAGSAVAALAGPLGVRLPSATSPALLVRATAPAGLIRTIVVTPRFEARESSPGHLLMTAPLTGRPAACATAAVDALREVFRGGGDVRMTGWQVSDRPMPPSGPVIGPIAPDLSAYVAVMHAGVTLAPTVGRLVARHLTTGTAPPELLRCLP